MKKLEKLSKTKFNVLDRNEMTKVVGGSSPCKVSTGTSEHTSTYQGLLGWDHDSRPEYSIQDCYYA